MPPTPPGPADARCPICDATAPKSKYTPFCSSRCQLIDLGNWLGERYVIPAAPEDDPDGAPAPGPASDGTGEEAHDRGSR